MKKENKSGKIAPEHSTTNEVHGSAQTNSDEPHIPAKDEHAPVEGYAAKDGIETNEDYNQRLKERFEEKRNAKLIKYESLIDIAPEFALWLKTVVRYGNVDSQVLIYWYCYDSCPENRFRCIFYTNNHKYSISGYVPIEADKDNKGYLGCVASTRKPRPGEDWTRGNDLPDGNYSKQTFDKIVRGILGYEIKNLQLWR